MNTRDILQNLSDHKITVEEALLEIKTEPFVELGYAKVDIHRKIRQGVSEVIYGAGKSADQIIEIANTLIEKGANGVLITRIDEEKLSRLEGSFGKATKIAYNQMAKCAFIGDFPKAEGVGKIVVVTAGTSDIPVAEEAAFTAEALGNEVVRVYDAGVAGIHRLLAHQNELSTASVVIAIAGMEGALASVIGGLCDCPVIAVPTSVGYGANFGGISALLSMLNSCASGVSVVNIDNGFGAAYQASLINKVR